MRLAFVISVSLPCHTPTITFFLTPSSKSKIIYSVVKSEEIERLSTAIDRLRECLFTVYLLACVIERPKCRLTLNLPRICLYNIQDYRYIKFSAHSAYSKANFFSFNIFFTYLQISYDTTWWTYRYNA